MAVSTDTLRSKIVVVGSGFAGLWSALGARRLMKLKGKESEVEIIVIAPEPRLVLRPRLYEANPASMVHNLTNLFDQADIKFIQGTVDMIDHERNTISYKASNGASSTMCYNRLILAMGSSLVRPEKIAGLRDHAFDIDTIDAASRLETHLKSLPSLPQSSARDTIVVCGAGFTGLEIATELGGTYPNYRVVLVEGAKDVGPELGPGPRPTILAALNEIGIETKLGSPISYIDKHGVTLASGERIEALTAIWTAGVRANTLTEQIHGPKDSLSRISVNQDLRVPAAKNIFATGDTAHVLADIEGGRHALMSCQHALHLGRVSGYNAAADLLNEPTIEYSQAAYNCCLDLGSYGAVVARGWNREVNLTGAMGKRAKGLVNTKLIYPPENVKDAINAADPNLPGSDYYFDQMAAMISQL